MWPEYSLDWTIGGTRYRIVVENPDHRSHGIASAQLDGVAVDARAIPLVDDGGEHEVRVVLGAGVREDLSIPTPGMAEQSGG